MRYFQPVVVPRQVAQMAKLVVACTALLGGCSGTVTSNGGDTDNPGDDGDDGTSTETPIGKPGGDEKVQPPAAGEFGFHCDSDAVPKSTPLRRLTVAQLKNTFHDLVRLGLKDDAQATTVLSSPQVSAALTKLGKDTPEKTGKDKFGSYRRLDQTLQQDHVDGTYDVAVAIAAELTSAGRLGKLVGTCATDTDSANDADCLNKFISGFGERAFRRPLTAQDVALMKTFYGSGTAADPLAYADLVTGFLAVPWFLYHVEHGGNDTVGAKANYYKLSDFELASRLSYQFTETMPDEALFEAARAGLLTKDAKVYSMHLDRLVKSAATKDTIDQFVFDQFKLFPSEIRDLEGIDARSGDTGFKKFAGSNMPSKALGRAMQDEILAMGRHFTWTNPGSFRDLMANDLSFASNPELAKIYGVAPWSGSGTPPALPAGERSGFLGRAAFLTTGLITTRPIVKGVFIREHVLCDELGTPPPAAANTAVNTMNKTTRESIEGITEQPNTVCAGCHRALINPLGFITENFDALGRLRNEERLFDNAGNEYAKKAVNTRAVPEVTPDDTTEVSSLGDLVKLIDKSGKAEGCFARGYFRFTFQRWDDIDQNDLETKTADACVVEHLRKTVRSGSLVDSFKEVALTTAFQSRSFD